MSKQEKAAYKEKIKAWTIEQLFKEWRECNDFDKMHLLVIEWGNRK